MRLKQGLVALPAGVVIVDSVRGEELTEQVEDGHRRHEERSVTAIHDPEVLPPGWPGVAAVVLVGRERSAKGTDTSTAHYYITSLRGTAEQLGRLARRYWSVENELHWILDMAFGEDAKRTAAGPVGANLGLIRRVGASLLQLDPGRGSIKARRLSAAWDDGCMARAPRGLTKPRMVGPAAAPDAEAAYEACASLPGLSNANCDGPGNRTDYFALGIHQPEELIERVADLTESVLGLSLMVSISGRSTQSM
jgi:hypothetical protein